MTLPAAYFDDLYARSADPWGFDGRWYEERKRALTLALLPAPRYATAYEPGCSIGVLTRELAGRCDALLATDIAASAVTAARQRCAGLRQVTVEQAMLPTGWPPAAFDLVVLSELGYYFDESDLATVASYACGNDTVVAVHWRHPVADYPLGGDRVHEVLAAEAASQRLSLVGEYRDDDLVAAAWRRDPRSVATEAGLS